jgi:hypothetical protein
MFVPMPSSKLYIHCQGLCGYSNRYRQAKLNVDPLLIPGFRIPYLEDHLVHIDPSKTPTGIGIEKLWIDVAN